MANLKLASAFLFCFLSLSYALTSSDIPDARDIQYDDIIVLPSSDSQQTFLPKSESESSSVPVDENLIPVDLTGVKEDRDDLPDSSPLEVVSFHHINRHHRPRRAGRKEISYGNDMIMSSHENFENLGFEEDQGFGEDGGLRRFHHHHHHHHHHHDFDGEVEGMKKEGDEHPHGHHHHHHFDREVEGMEKEGDEHPHGHHHHFDGEVEGMEKEGDEHPHGHHHHFDGEVEAMEKEGDEHPRGHWFHQRKFGGEEEHPFHHRFHHHHHHHEEEEREEAGLLFKLKQFFNGF